MPSLIADFRATCRASSSLNPHPPEQQGNEPVLILMKRFQTQLPLGQSIFGINGTELSENVYNFAGCQQPGSAGTEKKYQKYRYYEQQQPTQ